MLTTPLRKTQTLSICDEDESIEIDLMESPDSHIGPRMFDTGTMAAHAPSLPVSVNSSTYTN